MNTVSHMLAAMVIGALISMQAPLNVLLSRAIGSAYGATAISVFVAFLSILVIVLLTGWGEISRNTLSVVPWWVYLAGIVGAVFVAGGVVIVPVTGALVFFICVVAGQLLGSVIADHFGAFGLAERSVSVARLAGIVLVLIGATMVGRG